MGAMDVRMIEEWRDEARRALTHEAEALKEQLYQRQCYMQALDATEDLVKEVKELEDHQLGVPVGSGEQGGGRCAELEPPDGLRGGYPLCGYRTSVALRGYPARYIRLEQRGFRRAADRTEEERRLDSLRCKTHGEPQAHIARAPLAFTKAKGRLKEL